MSIVSWLVLGLIAGFIASKIVDGSGAGLTTDLVLGVVGAFVGGGVFHFFGEAGVTGFNFWSLFVAVVGAVLVLVAYHAVSGRRSGVRT
ncbi:MAG: GlsB/YeaQ/YmgE family stress response membrane protein [Myxococcales bacterium]|nr:GlsB/YeaQ/YmgE family stress response membrane protein [Myxococcales bacterium]